MTDPRALAARLAGRPALLAAGQDEWVARCVEGAALAVGDRPLPRMGGFEWLPEDSFFAAFQPYEVRDGVLRVPVSGMLVNDFPFAIAGWVTGYEYVEAAVRRGVEDSAVRGIALVIDSPGGLVAGNFVLNDRLHALRGAKPITAFAAEVAYSAAYSIASAADRVVVSPTGGAGSVGVVVVHAEMSKRLEAGGITIDVIRSRPGKMEGNPYEELSPEARARIQEEVDHFHTEFASRVARNRSMSVEAVDATNALTFMAPRALEIGFADEVAPLDEALAMFVANCNPRKERPMAETQAATITEEALASAVASARAEGVAAERARITGILNAPEAANRGTAARALIETDMALGAATAFLARLPEEVEAPENGAGMTEQRFKQAMRDTPNPEVGASADKGDADEGQDRVARARAARGLDPRTGKRITR